MTRKKCDCVVQDCKINTFITQIFIQILLVVSAINLGSGRQRPIFYGLLSKEAQNCQNNWHRFISSLE